MRVLLIRPSFADPDVAAHARSIAELTGVALREQGAPHEDRLAYVARLAGEMYRNRSAEDLVITAGPAALAAAAIGWRGPIVHLPVGRLTPREAWIGRRLSRQGRFTLVTTSAAIVRQATQTVTDPRRVRIVRPSPPEPRLTRDAARAKLGVNDDQTLVYVPGIPRHGSNHRLGIWAANILYFRDSKVRVLLRGGGPRDGFVRRFLTSAEMWPAVVTDATFNEGDDAVAADVAICAADGAPDVVPLAALDRAGTPIVGLHSTWSRERLPFAAIRVTEAKARLVARAALEAIESARHPPRDPLQSFAGEGWRDILASIRTRA